MREAVFSSLGALVEGSRVIDLFAGTGAYGLEAISRGAAQATFYEINRDALACLRQNRDAVLKACDLETSATRILARDVYTLETAAEKADLIFIDPPYSEIESRIDLIFAKADQHATGSGAVVSRRSGDSRGGPKCTEKPAGYQPGAGAVVERTRQPPGPRPNS